MDPVSVLTVFFKVAMHLPSQQFVFKNKNIDDFSRTELIEIYRNDMNKKISFTNNRKTNLVQK
tara:strand:- start:100 stop:288 length:189 start_codon:yes stop_codon:yes gene_type:complete